MKRSQKKKLGRETSNRVDAATGGNGLQIAPVFAMRPSASTSKEELAGTIADGIIEHINADRARRGLPPMPKE